MALEAQLVAAPVRPLRETPGRRPTREAPLRGPDRDRRRASDPRRGRAQTGAPRLARAQTVLPRPALHLQAPRLDRIVRGRAWIPVLGAMLLAIVGLRVEVLKLGASVGTEVQLATALQSRNAALASQISALSDNQRIAKLAAQFGMHQPLPLDVSYLQNAVGHHDRAAIRNITPPSRQTFLGNLATEEHSDQLSTQYGSNLSAIGGAPNTNISTSSAGNSGNGTSSSTTNGATQISTSSVISGNSGGVGAAGSTGAPSTPPGGSTSTAPGASTSTAGTPPVSTATGATGATGVGSGGGAGGLAPGSGQATGSANGGSGLAG